MHPLTHIWLNPRETYRSADFGSPLLRFFLIWAWGAAYALETSLFEGRLPTLSVIGHTTLCLVIGIFGGYFYFWSVAFAMTVCGSWFKGSASTSALRKALILGGIPRSLMVVFLLLLVVALGEDFFTSPEIPGDLPTTAYIFDWFLLVAVGVLSLWSIFSTAHTVAEAQQYASAWRGFFHTVVAHVLLILVLAVPISLCLWLILMH